MSIRNLQAFQVLQTVFLKVFICFFINLCILPSTRLLFIHPFTHSSIHPHIHPSIHTAIHPFTHSSIHPHVHPSIHTFINQSTHPLIHSSTHLFTHSPIDSSINSSTHAPSSTHSSNHQFRSAVLLSPVVFHHPGRVVQPLQPGPR